MPYHRSSHSSGNYDGSGAIIAMAFIAVFFVFFLLWRCFLLLVRTCHNHWYSSLLRWSIVMFLAMCCVAGLLILALPPPNNAGSAILPLLGFVQLLVCSKLVTVRSNPKYLQEKQEKKIIEAVFTKPWT